MSEEEDTDDVPKGMMISGLLTIIVYCALAVSVEISRFIQDWKQLLHC